MEIALDQVAAKVVVPGLAAPLFYALPSPLPVGAQVTVELGKRLSSGWIVGLESREQAIAAVTERLQAKPQLSLFSEDSAAASSFVLKPVLEGYAAFTEKQLQLFEWMAEYYGCNLSEVIENALPRKSLPAPVLTFRLTDTGQALRSQEEEVARIAKRAPLQGKILRALFQTGEATATELEVLGKSARAALKSLCSLGLVTRSEELPAAHHVLAEGAFTKERPGQLTESQRAALESIDAALTAGEFSPLLLFGVTGSGKTEVYLRAIEKVLAEGKSALVIVPEISLTPQLTDQFQSRLKVPLAVLHSQVGSTPRWLAWEALLRGEIRVAIGARSAVFAPIQNLALVIVDEEHEHSYKQSDGLRYNGRDVAVMRGKLESCPVILGSATPSFETLLNAMRGRYQLLELPDRATTRPVPKIEIVDLTKIKRKEMISPNISPILYEALKHSLGRGEQAVILYNRRGFSTYLQCVTCGEVVSCKNCSVVLTYHKRRDYLLCHYCNLTIKAPRLCQFCADPRTTRLETDGASEQELDEREIIGLLEHRGAGTERVVDELTALFPEARIARMDRDTVTAKDSYRRILSDMRMGATDILVGTQMIAKGHDLPGVTLVGIIDADIGLHLPDFRSSEKVFQLITQAAGRAGRGTEAGRVLVQTRQPNHPTIVATATGRFKAFARYELEHRKALGYPPFGNLLRVVVSGESLDDAHSLAHQIAQLLSHFLEGQSEASILGPSPAPHERLRGWYRYHLLIKAQSKRLVSELARKLYLWRIENRTDTERFSIDVDPVEML